MSLHEAVDAPVRRDTGARRPEKPRPDIEVSWRACVDIGLRHDRFEPPRTEIDGDSALLRAGRFVIDRLGRDLGGSGVAVVLIDERARIIDRHAGDELAARRLDRLMLAPGYVWRVDTVGTTALGLATRNGTPATVHGSEHFMDVLTAVTTVAVPICDPRTGRLSGALALVCGADIANVLLLPTARRGAREVELRWADDDTDRQRLVNEAFLRHRRLTRGPLVLVDEHVLRTNVAAAGAFTEADRPALWDAALRVVRSDATEPVEVATRDGMVGSGTVTPIYDDQEMIAALLTFPPRARRTRGEQPAFGWESLTDTERTVVHLVTEGLTNREIASRVCLSRHTVDSHLRHIFRKLDINSRVELTRIAAPMLGPATTALR
jgi:transcriptional regulator of acetoin/glycerol metabolism/DNA-binding CsgD family transcriptional regulator